MHYLEINSTEFNYAYSQVHMHEFEDLDSNILNYLYVSIHWPRWAGSYTKFNVKKPIDFSELGSPNST